MVGLKAPRALLALALALGASLAQASHQTEMASARANPIRKVVTMLQNMQKKVQEEGEKEKELYEKFMCYCKNGKGALEKSISDAEAKVGDLTPAIEEAEAKLAQLKEDAKKDQADREAAKEAMAEATAIREKEAAAYAAESSEDKANIASIEAAVKALEAGMAGGFLQTNTAQVLRQLLNRKPNLGGDDHEEVLAFLSSSSSDGDSYAPQSGQIVGILKQMGDEMAKGLAEATAAEEASIKEYEELMAAKKKEIAALTKAIETGLERIGKEGVNIVAMKNDLGETGQALIDDKKFLADLDKNCATKTADWEERSKTRAEELVALAETIKVLNDDDALELFKKTLPSPSFVQIDVSAAATRARALALLQRARTSSKLDRHNMDFILLAIRGKKIGFEKVIKMIDEMVETLHAEQKQDDQKKEYCAAEFDVTDDKKKGLEHSISDLEASIADTQEGIAAVTEEIKALQEGIKALDESVAEATENRKQEHEEYVELMASDSAAKELLAFAKNRLNKFYNPKLYKAPPKRVLSEEERITVNMGGTLAPTAAPGGIAGTGIATLVQVSEHVQRETVAPPPPPETYGAYTKKGEESNGVIAMIDLLIKDLEKEMTEAETEEKDGQADYEKAMSDAATKRAEDSKTLTEKGAAKADMEASLQQDTESKEAATKELMATEEYLHALHLECDWLLQYFDVRKEARASEVDALKRAKAVLSGADYSLLQRTSSNKFLHRA